MADLRHLYQAVILDHAQQQHHAGQIAGPDVYAKHTKNQSCGDDLQLMVAIRDDQVTNIGYEISGCILSKASTSIMADQVLGRPVAEVTALADEFSRQMMGEKIATPKLGREAQIVRDVVSFPIRIKCVMLPWQALKDTIQQYQGV